MVVQFEIEPESISNLPKRETEFSVTVSTLGTH